MIIDCHGHYTTAPEGAPGVSRQPDRGAEGSVARAREGRAQHQRRRDPRERSRTRSSSSSASAAPTSRSSRRARRRWRTTSAMRTTSLDWTRHCNDLIHRVCALYPGELRRRVPAAAVAGRAARPTASPSSSAASTSSGFIGCNLNPDPSGGHWTAPPLTDEWWYPLYEKMVELDVPAMVHVSASCNPNFHATGAHYINADTTAFMQFLTGGPVQGLPDAALHHSARRRRGAVPLGPLPRPRAGHEAAAAAGADAATTCSSTPASTTRPGIDLLLKVVPVGQHPVRLGDGRRGARHRPGDRPLLRRHQALHRCRRVAAADKRKIFEGNARKVYPRISKKLMT